VPIARPRHRARPVRQGALGLLPLLTLALVACSDDGDDPDEGAAPPSTTGIVSALVREGRQTCQDEPGDVTVSAEEDVPPPSPQPGVDLLSVTSTLDDEIFTTRFELAGPPDPKAEFFVAVGLYDDLDGFDLEVTADDGGRWGAEITLRTAEGAARSTPLRGVDVVVDEASLELIVPTASVRKIQPDHFIQYGASTPLLDGDQALDAEGEPVDDPALAAYAFDNCTGFGQ